MADKYYRALHDALKVLIEMPDNTHAERVLAHPPLDLLTDGGDGAHRRLRVDVGQTGFWAGHEFRISHEFTLTATPIWFKVSSPVDFILQAQNIACDQGGVRMTAFRSTQGTPSGVFNGNIAIWKNNGVAGTPEYLNQLTINSGGLFVPNGGQTPTETIRVMSNPGAPGITGGVQNTVSGSAHGERGLPAGDYYLKFERITGVTVDALGVYTLIWEERP